jgi:hypothetical protein
MTSIKENREKQYSKRQKSSAKPKGLRQLNLLAAKDR